MVLVSMFDPGVRSVEVLGKRKKNVWWGACSLQQVSLRTNQVAHQAVSVA